MLNQPLDDRGAFLLSQIGHHVSRRFTERLAPLGVEPAHFGILTHLAGGDGRSQQELADLLKVHRNAMVGLIDELEGRGLIQRRPHPADRRAHAVHLTEQAHVLLAAATAEAEALEGEILAPLDGAERAQLIQLLRRTSAQAGLPRGAHPGLQRRRRAARSAPAPSSR
ncbi:MULTISPECIES: MarR family winged helix-turn-helix transcriptional regulator [Nocardia]|uniref:MarR family winged helix-turn-helix transcriptional regulator n=1 Tax=Nocardia TaxID=1817 RepID=UPI0009FCE72B|nr:MULTISPECIES: MarR family transcriptional regulator [Nocardia]MBF6341165.1 MarR family transcriptional regulator [Nocardia abscessus]